jgi:hypothetical protein
MERLFVDPLTDAQHRAHPGRQLFPRSGETLFEPVKESH